MSLDLVEMESASIFKNRLGAPTFKLALSAYYDCKKKRHYSFAMHAAKKAKTDGHPVERAVLYQILHTRKDGFAVNSVVKAKMDKMKELLTNPSNQLQSSDTSGFDEMKERLSHFEEMEQRIEQRMEQRMARMLQQMQQIFSQCNQDVLPVQHSPALSKSSVASHQPSSS
ncbi:hypothetical protein CMV_013858 [Castanea mollissima]|uniref:Uncharacterized protein n=1 Tax=Castanea mollissima TaxID=60419 RepID=A0A8J4RCB8_9ROSI|nr:hypothetical protein CMV_013858 [Castanea mollissima]